MFDEVFDAADVATCPVILGRELRPLSVFASLTLKGISSPYATGKIPDAPDLFDAVLICSRTREELRAILNDAKTYRREFKRMGRVWGRMTRPRRVNALKRFSVYMERCTVAPDYWESANTKKQGRIRTPFEWHCVAMLLSNRICQTEAEAWDYSLSRALCWSAVIGERNGSESYIDPVDRRDIDKLKEMSNG
jgi:hypothetical protein